MIRFVSPLQGLRLGTAAVTALVMSCVSTQAATYRNRIEQDPVVPNSAQTVRVWMDSNTVDGEAAAIEYHNITSNTYVKVRGTKVGTTTNGSKW